MDKREFTNRVVLCEARLFKIAYLSLSCYADCEDAVQESLVKAWKRRDSLRAPEYFETWLTRILINECRDIRRRSALRPTVELGERADLPVKDPPDPALRDAVRALDEKHRAPIVLRYLAGYSVKETAQLLNLTTGVVRWRVSQGMARLRAALQEEVEL